MREIIYVGGNGKNCDVPPWEVKYTGKATKQRKVLPPEFSNALLALVKDLQWGGPVQKSWPHYGMIKGQKKNIDIRHCHLNKGYPTYVVAWKVVDKAKKIMEIIHVGTHEKTNYRRMG